MKKNFVNWAAELSVTHREFDLMTVKNETIMCTGTRETSCENAVVLFRVIRKKHLVIPKHCVLSLAITNAAPSTQEILSWYVCRWPIEVFFRQCKDKLALTAIRYACTGIKRYWLLMSLAHFHVQWVLVVVFLFETGYHEICDTIQLEKYRYLFQCAKESNDFDSFMKFAV